LRPLRVVATNLETLERTVFCSGEVAAAVHASVAVPGICVPVTLGGEIYVDGGIVDPLPVDILREMGVGRVIAVNAIPTPDRIRYSRQAERELGNVSKAPAREVIRKLAPVDEHLNYFARGNILEILMRSIHGAQGRMAESLGRQADIVLRPEICDDRWVDFRSPGKYIALGRKIAERHLEEIKTLVGKKAGPYERHPTVSSLARAA
jgi:NTE family protein